MTSQTPDMQAVLERLEKLERVCASMAEERASFHVVEASAFVLKDSEGRIRAVLQMQEVSAQQRLEWKESQEAKASLTLFDSLGHPKADLREGVLVVGSGQDHYAQLLVTEQAGARLLLNEGTKEEERSAVGLGATKDGPQITVLDAQGFKTVIGNFCAGSEVGLFPIPYETMKALFDKRQLSAASLVMVDKDGKVIWRAP